MLCKHYMFTNLAVISANSLAVHIDANYLVIDLTLCASCFWNKGAVIFMLCGELLS